MVGGFVITPEYPGQLGYVFPRVAFAVRLRFQRAAPASPSAVSVGDSSPAQDCSIHQWLNGLKVVRGSLSATVTFTDEAPEQKGLLAVTCRGPVDQRKQLFFLQVLIISSLQDFTK